MVDLAMFTIMKKPFCLVHSTRSTSDAT